MSTLIIRVTMPDEWIEEHKYRLITNVESAMEDITEEEANDSVDWDVE